MKILFKRSMSLLLLVTIIVSALLLYRGYMQWSIDNKRPIVGHEGINSLKEINIGGANQWVQVRSVNRDNPILLVLHGGPGSSLMGKGYLFQNTWEKHFTVVHWDQRGAGKSHASIKPYADLNIDQIKSDVVAVIQHLRATYKKEKVFLLGHSWGSYLGAMTAREHPELLHAYIGVGQVVNMWEGERLSYEYTLQQAEKRNDEKGLKLLRTLAPYPSENMVKKLFVQREYLNKYGGNIYGATSALPGYANLLVSPEYSLMDLSAYINSMLVSINLLWDSLIKVDLNTEGYDYKVPIFFFTGRHDYAVPADLTYNYFQSIQAPHKEFIWFDMSAHSPMISETEKFSKELIDRVRPMALSESIVN